jgi:hypothetical protein
MRVLLPALAVAAGLGLAACGSLNDHELTVGAVEGTLATPDLSVATVDDVAQGLSTGVSTTGDFELREVPQGVAELFVVSAQHRALWVSTAVSGGQVTQLGQINTLPAGNVVIHLRTQVPDPQNAAASIDGTPYKGRGLDHSGAAVIGPLPDGCYTGTLVYANTPPGTFNVCLSQGQDESVDATLP